MQRFILASVIVTLWNITPLSAADENVRAVQNRLKEGGFYFGELNGVYDGDTSAAVSRYQIRNGLPITGQLNAETTKSLGVAAAGPPATRSDRETWGRLRKTDPQFLETQRARDVPRPKQPAVSRPQPEAPTAPPDASPYGSVLVLSRERLRDYVGAFVLAGLDPQEGAELEFFADRVRYFNEGIVDREKIRRDLQRYNSRWPERRFSLAGEVKVEPQPDSRLRVTFPLRFDLRNAGKRSSGKVQKTLIVEVMGDDLQIVGVDERKAK